MQCIKDLSQSDSAIWNRHSYCIVIFGLLSEEKVKQVMNAEAIIVIESLENVQLNAKNV